MKHGIGNEMADEVMSQLNDSAGRIGKDAAAVSRRFSAKFAEYARKDPPRAALAALAVGAIIGWVTGVLCRD